LRRRNPGVAGQALPSGLFFQCTLTTCFFIGAQIARCWLGKNDEGKVAFNDSKPSQTDFEKGNGFWQWRAEASDAVAAGDVILQAANGDFLVRDDGFDEVADADDADEFVLFKDREMADVFVSHQGHAFLDGVIGADKEDLRGHEIGDGGSFRGKTLEDDFPGVVALREDANQFAIVYDRQGADLFMRHEFEGVVGGGFGTDCPRLSSGFGFEQLLNGGHGMPPVIVFLSQC
jgi:hypothetical protein